MLDRLETELIEHILDTAQHSWHHQGEASLINPPQRGRRWKPQASPLKSCCLVSHRMRAVAQPLLYRDVKLPSYPGGSRAFSFAATLKQAPQNGQMVRRLEFRNVSLADPPVVAWILRIGAKAMGNLQTVVFCDGGRVENMPEYLSMISLIETIRNLEIMSWDIPVNANLSFPFLTSLSLDVLGLEDDNAVPLFLSPTILPSLRYLTLSGTKDGPSVFPPIRPPLFQQLELLHVQNNGHAPGLDLSPYASAVCPILFDLRFNGPLGHPGDEELPLFRPSTAHVRHLALSLDDAISERIPFIVDSLPKSNLRTLFLPLEWDTPDSLQAGATGD